MEFLKKHYEKIILSAVLLGLGAAAFWLSVAVEEAKSTMVTEPAVVPVGAPGKPLDLTAELAALNSLTNPPGLILSGEHNLFNPLTWKVHRDGTWHKIMKEGAGALVVTNITPVWSTIRYDSQAGTGYWLISQVGNAPQKKWFASLNDKDKTKAARVVGIEGAETNVTAVKLEIADTGEVVSVATNNPYKHVIGFEADLKYDPDALSLNRKHVEDSFTLSTEPYKIIAITNNAVTVQNTRTTQKTTIPWPGAH